ncbi:MULTISPECIES: GNAT family N-acetyltransferase [Leptolyngbya]|uniref:GNAT family N-acetyltransferase n=1 Tax=Leptolyngbya boryana CZ1 TaxID=3060204 RepID=A0AA96WNT9_LEPBY|nr:MULTISPECIES: GNAT family N-acetyltransferase [Leptolyngbya]MBN8562764.1 GNAT family N-acetyltransferase [Leptolyngbya sp. UWPOB_LEPTO1]MCY6490837.1 GNAT family N-acetyltransferase [Leptolyngbya sp. GGD]WNZ43401.1 GNAT family N-acetyltransferase [Leptolyngbya boryana CZ1]
MILERSPAQPTIKVADFRRDFEAIQSIRIRVFQIEQGVDAALEFDGLDADAVHFLAWVGQDAVGTSRIRFLSPQTAKMERLAVLPELRKYGVGRKIVETVLEFLANKNIATVQIHAQSAVVEFYRKLGFISEGEEFEEAGIPHIKMSYTF